MIDLPATKNAFILVATLFQIPNEKRKHFYKILCEFDKRGVPPQDFFEIMNIINETEV